jgi:hypothetical protein
MKEGREGHARTQRAPGEKGVLERDTGGMCVSKILTDDEERERKKERESPPGSMGGRRGVRARATLYSSGGRNPPSLVRRRSPRQLAPPRLSNPRTSHREPQRWRWKQERTRSERRVCTFLPASPPAQYHGAQSLRGERTKKGRERTLPAPLPRTTP